MPYSIIIPLHVVRTLPEEGGETPRALNALFYRWLEAAEPRLARFVHEQVGPKPFTLSPLMEREPEEQYWFRLTLLEDRYWEFVAEGIKQERTVRIGQKILGLNDPARITHRAYPEIAAAASDPEIALRFETPTTFRSREMSHPLPEARLVFQSYLERWNAFAPEALEPRHVFLDWVANHVAVSRFDLRTEVVEFESHLQIGCVGQVHYRVARRLDGDAPMVHWLNRLADYSRFCGTGHRTTQGMGQTRRMRGAIANRSGAERDNGNIGDARLEVQRPVEDP